MVQDSLHQELHLPLLLRQTLNQTHMYFIFVYIFTSAKESMFLRVSVVFEQDNCWKTGSRCDL